MTPKGQGKKYAWLQTEKGRAYMKRHNRNGAERQARYRANQTPEERAERLAAHANRERNWRATPHGKRMKRDSALRAAYGITFEQVEAMIVAQNDSCPICLETIKSTGKGKNCCAVDHDHDTGKVRGILCQSCNAAIGSLGDSTDTLKRAFDYLYQYKHKENYKCL